jgi:hypothetical protein
MYRELGTRRFGIANGPYASGIRSFDLNDLPEGIRERLRDIAGNTGVPSPIHRSEWKPRRLRAALLGAFLGASALVYAVATYQSGAMYHGSGTIAWYALAGGVFALSLYSLIQGIRDNRRAIVHLLLPCDLIYLDETRVITRSLGGLRGVTHASFSSELELQFDDGYHELLTFSSVAAADQAVASLERAQDEMEALTVAPDISRAAKLDPFQPLRGDELWNRKTSLPGRMKRVKLTRALVAGLSLCLGIGLGLAVRVFRNALTDDYVYATARRNAGSLEHYKQTSALRRHVAAAEAEANALREHDREHDHRRQQDEYFDVYAQRSRIATASRVELPKPLQAEEAALLKSAHLRYAKLHPANPAAIALVHFALERGSERGQRSLRVKWQRKRIGQPTNLLGHSELSECDPDTVLHEMEQRIIIGLNLVTEQNLEPYVLSFSPSDEAYDIDVNYTVRGAKEATEFEFNFGVNGAELDDALSDKDIEQWRQTPGEASDRETSPSAKVSTSAPAKGANAAPNRLRESMQFQLKMPPTARRPTLRERSVFASMSQNTCPDFPVWARAMDRLYDELYSWFFSGPVRVPIQATPVTQPK